jgi:hypothetical protein
MNSMLGAFQQMFEMFRAMQPPPTAPAPAFAPQPQQQFMPPPPPPGSDMPAMMAWMKQAFDIFQSATPAPAAQPQAQAPSSAQAGPSMPPPPGMMWGWIPGFGFALMPAGERPGFGRPVGDPRPRPPYMQERGSPYPENRGAPPQRERSAREQFNDAISVVRTAVEAVNDINTLLPNAMGAVAEAATSGGDDDDSPVKVIDTGHGKFVLDKNNGGFRGWESLYANLPDLLKWGAEQREAIQKAHAEQQRPQQPQQLPQGYVEMVPGYQPPTGFVAVPVEQLPPPPTNMPPPIQPQRQPSPWGEPTVPEREE